MRTTKRSIRRTRSASSSCSLAASIEREPHADANLARPAERALGSAQYLDALELDEAAMQEPEFAEPRAVDVRRNARQAADSTLRDGVAVGARVDRDGRRAMWRLFVSQPEAM